MASSKYRVKQRTSQESMCTGTQKYKPLIGKGKLLLMLVSGTAIVAGIYIACIQKMFAPIIPIYWITTGILMIAFLFVNKRNEYLYTKLTYNRTPSEDEKNEHRKRVKHMKYLLLVLLPFLFTVLGDVVYLFILKDMDLFGALKNLM